MSSRTLPARASSATWLHLKWRWPLRSLETHRLERWTVADTDDAKSLREFHPLRKPVMCRAFISSTFGRNAREAGAGCVGEAPERTASHPGAGVRSVERPAVEVCGAVSTGTRTGSLERGRSIRENA